MKFSRQIVLSASTLALLALAVSPSFAATHHPTATVPGEVLAQLKNAQKVASMNPQQSVSFAVVMNLPDEAGMKAFVESLSDPTSPNYHKFLSQAEFTQRFGPSETDYSAVQDYLESQGLTITQTYANRMLIDVSGSVANVQKAFQIQMNQYNLKGRAFFATANDVTMPADVAALVQGVVGLDNLAEMHANLAKPNVNNGSHAYTATSGYTPQQIHTAYNYTPLYSSGIDGSGQTIAVATAYSYSNSDISAFDSAFGLSSPNVSNINVDGTPTQTNDETTLDLEWSHATAPNARILMYQGANANLTTFTDVYNRIASDNIANAMTTSWGTSEDNMSAASLNADDNIFYEMAAQGQSMFAASGDNGATDGSFFFLETDYPSIDPYVTACGGTTLKLGSGNSYGSETGWSGSGGGESDYFAEPSWQTGTNVPQDGWRQSPDIALNADPNTGYSYFYGGKWGVAGGTSFVAPQMAGTYALVNQNRANHGLGVIGQADPSIYSLANSYYSDFHDVTSGNNGYYNCGAKFDNVTGWGSINANAFVSGLS